jgi:hypothetical protein
MISYAKMLLNPYAIGSIVLVGFGLYHFYSVSSLKSELLKKQKEIIELREDNTELIKAQEVNNNTIKELTNEVQRNEEIRDSLLDNKNKTISSLKKIITEEKTNKYQHIYTYDKCVIKIKGENNETSELIRVLDSIGF